MKKVITYGTYDLLHHGHIRLLERAKALGDYLIVGVTADDFDKTRGKINIQQSLMERVESVRQTGIADEIIIEEYEGQKIDDIRRLGVDIFTVGSDWVGHFDYLNEYCEVVYLDRTQGISSSELRAEKREIRLGLVGESEYFKKFAGECRYVNGVSITAICSECTEALADNFTQVELITSDYKLMLDNIDAVYIISHPDKHYQQIKEALMSGKHVLCEAPIALKVSECRELYQLADKKKLVLSIGMKTAYSTAYSRLLLLVKSGRIGKVLSVDATCTSLRNIDYSDHDAISRTWNSIHAWGPTAMLPIFQLLGTNFVNSKITTQLHDHIKNYDLFTKIDFTYPDAVASLKVGKGIKSEGELVISGTKGYVYVPAPWWKTDYFEIRYEDSTNNKRYFYQLDGEGIRYEIVTFVKAIDSGRDLSYVSRDIVETISSMIERFEQGRVVKI